jgi:hypothetical protein
MDWQNLEAQYQALKELRTCLIKLPIKKRPAFQSKLLKLWFAGHNHPLIVPTFQYFNSTKHGFILLPYFDAI